MTRHNLIFKLPSLPFIAMTSRMGCMLILLALTFSAAASDRDFRVRWEEPGTWRPWHLNKDSYKGGYWSDTDAPPEIVAEYERNLLDMVNLFRQTVLLNNPKGFDVHATGSVYSQPDGPLVGGLMLGIFPIVEVLENGQVVEHYKTHETNKLMIGVNSLGTHQICKECTMRQGKPLFRDAEGDIFHMPDPDRTLWGFPVYEDNLVVITRDGRSIFASVSQERALHALIAEYRRQAERVPASMVRAQENYEKFISVEERNRRWQDYEREIDKAKAQGKTKVADKLRRKFERVEEQRTEKLRRLTLPPKTQNDPHGQLVILKLYEDRLAALTSQQRAAPACTLNAKRPGRSSYLEVMPLGTPGCVPLRTQNPDFFNPRLRRNAIQVITLYWIGYLGGLREPPRHVKGVGSTVQNALYYDALQQVDWEKMRELVQ